MKKWMVFLLSLCLLLSGCGGSGHLGDVERGTMESGVREGNGLARITWVGYSLPKE